ncbi:MAG: ABC transporter ATP-binding protein [Schaedlerella sp.]|nr:ABC transporter ATP-binding protein [Schaedlerella sp.]
MLLEIKNLRGGYDKKEICKGISCSLDKGEILSVLGPNGCGKTTFFRLLLGSLNVGSGKILINGRDSSQLSKKELAHQIAYIPQHHSPIFAYSVLEIVMMGRASHISSISHPRKQDIDRAFAAMEMLHIEHLANHKYTALSGGQRQMVLIARAICQDAKIFVMDEPGASLDYANHQLLMEVIVELAKKGYGIIMSTHSPEHPFSIAHKVLLLKEGANVAFGSPSEAITSEILEQVYGIEMDIVHILDRYGKSHTLCIPLGKKL